MRAFGKRFGEKSNARGRKCFSREGQFKPKDTSLPEATAYPVSCTVQIEDLTDDGKPEPASRYTAAMARFASVVALPYVIKIFGRNSHAVIDDLKASHVLAHTERYANAAIRIGIIDGIVQKIAKHLQDLRTIGNNEASATCFKLKGKSAVFFQSAITLNRFLCHKGKVELFVLTFRASALNTRDL